MASRRKPRQWKPVPDHIKEYETKYGTIYYKEIHGEARMRLHGEWWYDFYHWQIRYPNIELPKELKTRINILFVLKKYELKQ